MIWYYYYYYFVRKLIKIFKLRPTSKQLLKLVERLMIYLEYLEQRCSLLEFQATVKDSVSEPPP